MPLEIWIAIIAGVFVVIFSSMAGGKRDKDDNQDKR